MNDGFIIDVLNILSLSVLFIQESFQVLESDVHEVKKKIQLEDWNLCLLFFFCTGYRKSSLGRNRGCDISQQEWLELEFLKLTIESTRNKCLYEKQTNEIEADVNNLNKKKVNFERTKKDK